MESRRSSARFALWVHVTGAQRSTTLSMNWIWGTSRVLVQNGLLELVADDHRDVHNQETTTRRPPPQPQPLKVPLHSPTGHRLTRFRERWRILPTPSNPGAAPDGCKIDLAVSFSAGWSPRGRGSLYRRRRLRTVQSSRQPEGHPSSDLTRCPGAQLHQTTLRWVAPRVESPTPRHTPTREGRVLLSP